MYASIINIDCIQVLMKRSPELTGEQLVRYTLSKWKVTYNYKKDNDHLQGYCVILLEEAFAGETTLGQKCIYIQKKLCVFEGKHWLVMLTPIRDE